MHDEPSKNKMKFKIGYGFYISFVIKLSPSFDEPGMRATYDVTIFHKPTFSAVFNTPVIVISLPTTLNISNIFSLDLLCPYLVFGTRSVFAKLDGN